MTKYNGHRSWNAWNVSLWINNDEGLYREAVRLVKAYGADRAARQLARTMAGEQTPDGGRYNLTCIREALRGIL
jgi:hypothetical protein